MAIVTPPTAFPSTSFKRLAGVIKISLRIPNSLSHIIDTPLNKDAKRIDMLIKPGAKKQISIMPPSLDLKPEMRPGPRKNMKVRGVIRAPIIRDFERQNFIISRSHIAYIIPVIFSAIFISSLKASCVLYVLFRYHLYL